MNKALILLPLICLVGGLSSCNSGDVTIGGTKPITTIKMGVKYYDRDYLVWYLDREHFDEEYAVYYDYHFRDFSYLFNADGSGIFNVDYSYYNEPGQNEADKEVNHYHIDFKWSTLNDGSILAFLKGKDYVYSQDHTLSKIASSENTYINFDGDDRVIFDKDYSNTFYITLDAVR